ncbi:MAG: hypothetical protein R3E48_16010 [Burkholderiaceae bacterium]
MPGQQRRPVSDAHRRDARLGEPSVQVGLVGGIERAGGFVEHHVARRFDEHSREGQALLFADRQQLAPVADRLEAAEAP